MPEFEIRGRHLVYCNCAYGCPCDFNAPPSYTVCEGALAVGIDKGHYGDTRLDGVTFAATFHFPDAIHLGSGQMQPVVDVSASEAQREAVFAILSGEGQPAGTMFQIFSLIVETIHEPQFLPIELEFDHEARTGRLHIPGICEATTEPIRNPVTGAAQRVRVQLPDGFEYREAEFASGSSKGLGVLAHDFSGRHSSLSHVAWNQNGVI